MKDQATEAVIAAICSKATYAGSCATFLGWFYSSDATVIFGLILGVTGLAINWYYKAKQDRRDQREHDAKMSMLDSGEGY